MSEKNPISEVHNADWLLDIERTYVIAAELSDKRITGNELRLLLMLRYRASGGDNNYVSHAVLAQDLGMHEKSVARSMSKLKKLGYVACRGRGYGKSNIKTIASVVERYDRDILVGRKKELFGANRSDELISKLQNRERAEQDKSNDSNSSNSTVTTVIDNGDIGSEVTVLLPAKVTAGLLIEVTGSLPKIDKQLDESELDSPRSARRRTQPEAESCENRRLGFEKGTAFDLDTGEVMETKAIATGLKKSKGENLAAEHHSVISEADGDERADAAMVIAAAAGASAHAKARERIAKTEARKDAKEASGEAEREREWKRATKQQRMTVKAELEEFMIDTFRNWFPDAIMGKFGGPEYGKLNHLLRIYDDDAVFIRKAWKSLCEDWEEIQKRLKIKDSVPTVGIFLGFRESIFAIGPEQKSTRPAQESKQTIGKYEG